MLVVHSGGEGWRGRRLRECVNGGGVVKRVKGLVRGSGEML